LLLRPKDPKNGLHAGHLDQASPIEFKDLVLAFVGLDGFSQTRQGRTLLNAHFSIVGTRRDQRPARL
jgi:hypothetical protein